MVKKNVKKLKAKKHRVMNGFNTGTRDMKLETAYQRKKRWSAEMPTTDCRQSGCETLGFPPAFLIFA